MLKTGDVVVILPYPNSPFTGKIGIITNKKRSGWFVVELGGQRYPFCNSVLKKVA